MALYPYSIHLDALFPILHLPIQILILDDLKSTADKQLPNFLHCEIINPSMIVFNIKIGTYFLLASFGKSDLFKIVATVISKVYYAARF